MKTIKSALLGALPCFALFIGCVDDPSNDLSDDQGGDVGPAPELPDTPPSEPNLGGPEADGTTMLVHVYYQTEAKLDGLVRDFDVLEHADRKAGYVAMLVEPDDYDSLIEEGFQIEVQAEPTAMLQKLLGGLKSIPNFSCYRTVEETNAAMTALAGDYADLVELVDIGDSWDKFKAGGPAGYDLSGMIVTNQNIAGPKPRFFLMGSIHAREYATAELVIQFAEQMIQGYGTDPDATWLLDNFELHVLPHTNPDGRKIAEMGYTQRKNRNTNKGNCSYPPTSSSQHGIDLNRNHAFKYGGAGTSTAACNLTYRGTGAASEPETQALQTYLSSIFADQRGPLDSDPAPDTTTGIMISLHSYSPLVLFPWSAVAGAAPNLAQLRTLGRKFGYHTQYPVCQAPICLYAASGSTDDWAYGTLGIAAYTFEVGTSFFQSCSTFESTVAPTNLAALRDAFKAARRPYQTPAGPDALAVAVSAASVSTGTSVTLSANIDDARYDSNGWGDEPVQNVGAARYSVDQPSWSAGTLTSMTAADGTFDATLEGVTATIDTTGWALGRHSIMVEGQDTNGNWGAPSAVFLDIV